MSALTHVTCTRSFRPVAFKLPFRDLIIIYWLITRRHYPCLYAARMVTANGEPWMGTSPMVT
jgi:hypothetical protein